MKFAAIDIGSNAVRLLLARVHETQYGPFFKKESLVRMPIRLGEEAFSTHELTPEKVDSLVEAMHGFRHLIASYNPVAYMACATSAMREVESGPQIVQRIKSECDIDLQIIDGALEAEIIYANHFEERLDKNLSYLYIDVGGGSTELTIFSRGEIAASRSFNIGTVRLIQNLVPESSWEDMKKWIKINTKDMNGIMGIGSGGNINKMFRLSRTKEGKPVSYNKLKEIQRMLRSLSFEKRITTLNLRADRADVIVPASRIYLSAMKWAKVKQMYVPQIGLADGIIHVLYTQHKSELLAT